MSRGWERAVVGGLVAVVLAAGSTAGAGDAVAQAPGDGAADEDQARRVFELGRRAYEDERYAEAARYFGRAFDMSGRGELQYNIGAALERAGQPAEAVAAFERFLELVPDTDRRDEVEERLAVLRATGQSSAEPASLLGPDEGARGPGVAPFIVLGAGVAAAVAGGVVLVLAQGAKSNVEGSPEGTLWLDVADDAESAQTLGVTGVVLLGAGALVAACGLAWWIVGSADEEASASVAVVPSGLVVRGAF